MICVSRTGQRPFPGVLKAVIFLGLSSALFGQFRGGSDWSTNGGDAQRTSWVRTDPKITPTSVNANTFQLLWKVKLGNEPLTAPVLLDRYIGYRGFRTYAFVGGQAEDAFGLDSDLGRLEWQKRLSASKGASSGNCQGGMMAGLTRPVSASFPSNTAGRPGFGGRGGPAKSGVGDPLEGAVTLAQVAANRPPAGPPVATPNARPTPPAGGFGPRPTLMYALSGDGALHTMYVSNGEEAAPPIPFLPPNANVSDFTVVDGVAYATTTGHCGEAADGLWAADLTTKAVTKWAGSVTGGEAAFGPAAGYVVSDTKLLALDLKTLTAGASYDAGQTFTTAPVVFEYKTKTMIAAATKDGALHLIDGAAPGNAATKSTAGDADPYAVATWQTAAETRWIVVTGPKSITGWKIVEQNGSPTLQQGWVIRDVASPSAPLIINGVLFALERGDRSHHAVLSAFDASTGKQIWTSGNSVTSFVAKNGGLAAGGSTLYFGTHDGTLWAYGFPIEH